MADNTTQITTWQDRKNTVQNDKQDISTALEKLEQSEVAKVEKTFQEAKDFREIGEQITAPVDWIISETAKIIDKDPIMNVSDELEKMNGEVQGVYKEIVNNDGPIMKFAKSLPLIGSLAKSLDEKFDEASFNMKGIEGKIQVIFSWFDQSYNSLNTSIDMQKDFVDGVEQSLDKITAYKEFIAHKIEKFETRLVQASDPNEKEKLKLFIKNVEYFQSNLVVLIGNLGMARKRLLMRLDSATKLSLAMNSSRPIFKTLLSTAMIESSSQKAIDASMKAMDVMGSTIDKMSSELTDKAIESSKRATEMTSKPVLSTSVFIENVTKLKNHFDEIDDYRQKIKTEAKKEREAFETAQKDLDGIKTLASKSHDELRKEIIGG